MTHEEITNVFELSLDAVGLPLLDRQTAPLIVAVRTPGLRVAVLAHVGLARRGYAMTLEPGCIVA
jgi:hypothetical protein